MNFGTSPSWVKYALCLGSFFPITVEAQTPLQPFRSVDRSMITTTGERLIIPKKYRTVKLDRSGMIASLQGAPNTGLSGVKSSMYVLSLPMPDGTSTDFRIVEASIMEPALQSKFPNIRTYTGQGVADPNVTLHMDNTPQGFHAMILGGPQGAVFIDPYARGNTEHYICYYKKDLQKSLSQNFQACHYETVNDLQAEAQRSAQWIQQMAGQRVGDCQLRTYRLAVATTGEYANFHGSNTTNNDKSFAMGAITTTMVRVNGVYQRDATLTMVLVANNDQIIYLDGGNDPYTNGDGFAMLTENQTTCDNVIGTANYDIGHVFSTGGGGVASLNSPCSSTRKARGVTGQGSPVGDPFDIDYVAHEMGHQYGGNHTQNNNCNRSSASYEPGSASTIMGYAGICSPNVQSNSDALFHGYSMQEMAANITVGTSSTCPVVTPSGNNAPTANAGPDHTIPASTPFVLEGSATDPDAGDVLTYAWEQMDNAVSTQPPSATSTDGPNFRAYMPSMSSDRYLPRLSDLVTNTDHDWEELASVSRTFDFRLTVRDNAPGSGCNDQDEMTVTVDGGSGPLVVTSPNTAVTWTALQTGTVTWNVAGTNSAPVNATNVDILLSTDGGFTYPIVLATNTPNDGSQSITVANVTTTTARVMVKGSGNIFFDISDQDFTIDAPVTPDYTLAVAPVSVTVCQPTDAQYTVNTTSILGYSDPVNLSTSGLPAGLNASFSPNPVIPGNGSTLTITNTGATSMGSYPFDVNATSTSGNKSEALSLQVNEFPGNITLATPTDGATSITAGTDLTWNTDAVSDTYEVEIGTSAAMTTIVESAPGLATTGFTPVAATVASTTYYWRVRGNNSCGEGSWSSVWAYTVSDCIPVTVNIVMDRYGQDITWEVTDGSTSYASGGPYTENPANGEYPQPGVSLCLPPGCYDLIVNDSFGDGNCCTYGNGTINVTADVGGQMLAEVSGDIDQGVPAVENFCLTLPDLRVDMKMFLEGPFDDATSLMRDDLRSAGLIPSSEPYTTIFGHVGGGGGESIDAGVLVTTGNNAIVDWVYLELRDKSDNTNIIATRSALLQRDGDVVDMDGTSAVVFNVVPDNHFVAVRHRNHLGTMSATALAPTAGVITLDLTLTAASSYGTEAKKQVGTEYVLWTGNVIPDVQLQYTGGGNDRDPILVEVGGSVPTATSTGYRVEDTNMDGTVKYTGGGNDRDIILVNVGGSVPTATRQQQLP